MQKQNPRPALHTPWTGRFTFDHVFGPDTEQHEIYDAIGADLVESVAAGYNATVFAYGQTGSGKTHTMEGDPSPPEMKGLIPRCFEGVFKKVDEAEAGCKMVVRCSYLEVYNEEIRDLLSRDCMAKLELKDSQDSGVYVKDLVSVQVANMDIADRVMQKGKRNRKVGATAMSRTSSRSHAVFTLIVETGEFSGGEMKLRQGKLNLVDLAGSERQSKTHAEGERLKEAIKINQSLSALGNVISVLASGKSGHIPCALLRLHARASLCGMRAPHPEWSAKVPRL